MKHESSQFKKFDHLEFYVANAKQAAIFYSKCFGFLNTAYCGLETGNREITSYLMEQGEIRFVLSSGMRIDHEISQSALIHGDTIAIIALEADDVGLAYDFAVKQGAIPAIPPTEIKDENGIFRYAAIHGLGDTLIKFINRNEYNAIFLPGFISRSSISPSFSGLERIDHVVGNVESGKMEYWANFFVRTMGFEMRMHFDENAIATKYSSLNSTVLQNGNHIIFNINEPALGLRKSQIDEYLEFHNGPGIQHIGLTTSSIVETVIKLKQNGVEFLPIPQSYYSKLEPWVKEINIPIEQLAESGILIDRDHEGYLLQLFTKPIGDRPTLFFEIIERHGSHGFGIGNFKSLFLALEREQNMRGNL